MEVVGGDKMITEATQQPLYLYTNLSMSEIEAALASSPIWPSLTVDEQWEAILYHITKNDQKGRC